VVFIGAFHSKKGHGGPERNPFGVMTALKGILSGLIHNDESS